MKLELANFDLPQEPPSLIADLSNKLLSQFDKKLEDFIVEGLKRKGFEFGSKMEMEKFFKSNCKCEDRIDIKQRTFFVNDIPFFVHCYEMKNDFRAITIDREIKMSVNYGSYTYL
jgi:hypothetical protein